jgi:hypothetical protein
MNKKTAEPRQYDKQTIINSSNNKTLECVEHPDKLDAEYDFICVVFA